MPSSHLVHALVALWWFRRCFCARGVLRQPCDPRYHYHLCQSFPLPVCHLLRSCPLHSFRTKPNTLHTNSRSQRPPSSLANSGRWTGEVVGAKVRTKRSGWQSRLHGCPPCSVAREARSTCHGLNIRPLIDQPSWLPHTPSPPFLYCLVSSRTIADGAARLDAASKRVSTMASYYPTIPYIVQTPHDSHGLIY